jgi:hypothetical protein
MKPKAPKAQRCQHPGCSTLTLHGKCARHRPPAPVGVWAEAARLHGKGEG